jgi:hypothetical protein
MKCFTTAAAILLMGFAISGSGRADVVTDWNQNWQAAALVVGGPGALVARPGAIVHAAMFDALNGIEKRYAPVHVDFAFGGGAQPGSSRRAAVIQAAYATLVALYPAQKANFDAERTASLASIVDDPADVESSQSIARGLDWGARVAADIMAWRSTDGFNPQPPPYKGNLGVGQWRPTPPAMAPGVGPQIGAMTPWVIASGSQFRPAGPPPLLSPQYTADYNEVKAIGSAANVGNLRTPDQTVAAKYWQSPTQWFDRIALTISAQRGLSLSDNARLLALMHLALADAVICCWEAKYHYNFWRPITAINLGDTDGNIDTAVDAAWTPIVPTPAFPEYPSGHATVSPAQAVVLQSFFGDSGPFAVTSNAYPALPITTRSYNSFADAANEAFSARIWGGIHFFSACQDGRTLGTTVGNYVFAHALQPLKGKKLGQVSHNHGAGTVTGDGEVSGDDGL